MTAAPGFDNSVAKPCWGGLPSLALAAIEWDMRKTRLALALIIAAPMAGHAAPAAGVRLDFPPGYFAAKPPAAPQKASSSSDAAQDECSSHCANFDDGYAWAQTRSFKAEEQCRGRSRAFVE